MVNKDNTETRNRSHSPNPSFSNNYSIDGKRNKNKSSLGSDQDSYENLTNFGGPPGENINQSLSKSPSKLRMYIKDMSDFVIESPDV